MYIKNLCSLVLWLWGTVNLNVHSFATVPSVVYDWTKPLTALMDQNISYEEFIESLAFLPNGKFLNVSVIYSLDCNTKKDCAEKIDEVVNFCERTFNNSLRIDLIISLAILHEGKKSIRKPKFETKILANINDSVACNAFVYPPKHTNSISNTVSSSPSTLDVWYLDDNQINPCLFSDNFSDWFITGFVVAKYEIGVVESYGLFHKRMNWFYDHYLRNLVKEMRTTKNFILFYPNQDNFGDICHQQLFNDFIRRWLEDTNNIERSGVIVKEQNVAEKSTAPNKISLNGYIFSSEEPLHENPSVSILNTIYQHFSHFSLSYEEWVSWNTEMRNNSAKNYVTLTPGKELEIFLWIDGSHMVEGSNWSVVENEINAWKAEKWSEAVVLKTLMFTFSNYTGTFDFEFASRMSHHYTIACLFFEDYTATSMVKTCKEINGTLYFLEKELYLREVDLHPQDNTFAYEAIIKKTLEEIQKLGNSILAIHPEASIMIWLILRIEGDITSQTPTTFCDAKVLAINEHFEAILNWAKCNNLKIRLKPVYSNYRYPSFLSALQPVFWRHEGSDVFPVANSHPYFVLSNYPNNFNNWTIDPCIDATTVRPNVTEDFFQDKTIGVTFNTEEIKCNATLTTEEYKIILQFILNRFDLVEIVLPKNYEDLIRACKWMKSEKGMKGNNKTILLSYVLRETQLASIHAKLARFVALLQKAKLNSVEGIHLDLYNSLQRLTNHAKLLAVETSLTKVENKSIRIGILVDTACCLEFVRHFVSINSTIHPELKFLKKIHYLVCKEEHPIERMTDLNNMDRIFNTHLYLKKAIQEFLPQLNLYFHVDIIDHQRNFKFHSESHMKTVSNLMKFAAAYDIHYFLINAFDRNHEDLELNESTNKNGWWKVDDYTNLTDPSVYTEREAVYQRRNTWRPRLKKDSTTDSKIKSHFPLILALVAGAVLALGLGMGLFYYLRLRKLNQFLSKDEVKEFFNGSFKDSNPVQNQSMIAWKAQYLKFQANFEIELMDLQIETQIILGSGNFGTVYKGIAKETVAAIKQPNKNCTKDLFKSLLSEVKLLSYIGEHQNVVGFIGAYTKEIHRGVLYIATEFCKNGSLEKFLRQKKHVATSAEEGPTGNQFEGESLFLDDLCKFSHQIASGMEYIEGKHVVHGDLAARNILLDENHTCKIGDFGLSRKLYEYQKYVKKSQEPLPWKWMAYESLTKMEFTSKSDVWSFGVTIWEIFSLGNIPYSTVNWSPDFTDQLKNGLRLTKPEFASDKIYMKMLDCWNLDGEQRPSFAEMAYFFKELGYGQYMFLNEDENEFEGDSFSLGSQEEEEESSL